MNPRKYLEEVYDIRRNCATAEQSYSTLATQCWRSMALGQLLEFLYDEVMEEMSLSRPMILLGHSDTSESDVDQDDDGAPATSP